MILVKLTNEKLLELGQNPTFAPLVSALVTIQALNSATGKKVSNKEGYVEIGEKYLEMPTVVGLANEGVEFKPIRTYIEIAQANFGDGIPSYLPNATRTELIDDVEVEVQNTWEDILSRTTQDGTKKLGSIGELEVSQIAQLLGAGFTPLNVEQARAIVNGVEYQAPEE